MTFVKPLFSGILKGFLKIFFSALLVVLQRNIMPWRQDGKGDLLLVDDLLAEQDDRTAQAEPHTVEFPAPEDPEPPFPDDPPSGVPEEVGCACGPDIAWRRRSIGERPSEPL